MADMETTTIHRYAFAHDLDANALRDAAEGYHDRPMTLDSRLTVAELDGLAGSIEDSALDDLMDARDGLSEARESLAGAEENLRRAVREALSDGIAATRVAEALGVSRARVYQLRDGKR